MGEARRRKLLGTYPDDSKPEDRTLPVGPTAPAERVLVCENCQKAGGTLSAISNTQFVHVPDCQHAAASRAREQHRQQQFIETMKTNLRRARRLLRRGPKPAEPDVSEAEEQTPDDHRDE